MKKLYMLAETDLGYEIEIPKHIGRYEYVSVIGTGTSCVVVRIKDPKTGEFFACKIVSREDLVGRGVLLPFEQELRITQSIRHPYVVRTMDIIYEEKYIYIITEECTNGDLLTFICDEICRTKLDIRRLMGQVGSAIQYLHSRGISHLDIKPDNILLDNKENARLTDFGSCRHKSSTVKFNAIGTLYYCAPEILTDRIEDSHKCDIWSIGILLFTLATGSFPWSAGSEEEIISEISAGTFDVPPEVDSCVAEIIRKCTALNPASRPTIDELLTNPWFIRPVIQKEPEEDGLKFTPIRLGPISVWPKPRNSIIVRPKVGDGSEPMRLFESNSAILHKSVCPPKNRMSFSKSIDSARVFYGRSVLAGLPGSLPK